MRMKFLPLKRVVRTALLVLLLSAVGLTNAMAQDFTFTVGDLNYTVDYYYDEASVAVIGHVDGQNATGELVIPESVTYAGTEYSVTEIGPMAFQNCSGLTSVIIPNSVFMIGDFAFYGCSSIDWVFIPNSVMWMGIDPFGDCSALMYIMVEYGNLYYDSRENCNAIIETSTNSLVKGCQNTFIPNSVTSIGGFAFSGCTGLTTLTIPNSVTSIGWNAFGNCIGLTSLTIGNSVEFIGGYAFYNCPNISWITILAENPPTLADEYGNVFSSLGSNTPIFTPCGFKDAYASISWGGFSNFYGLCGGTVTVAADPGEGGTVIGGGTIEAGQPCTVTATPFVGYAFDTWTVNGLVVSNNAKYTFYLDSDMTIVAHFVPNDNIVFADANVKSICVAYWDTNNDGELSYEEAADVTFFADYPFYGSEITSFDEFQYFTGLSSLKSYFFNNCTKLTSIILPNSITEIESGAFQGCSSLTTLTIGNSVTSIGEYVFYGTRIANLTISDSVVSIGEYAFENSIITNLTIGNALNSISSYGFGAQSDINTVFFTGNIHQWCSIQFKGFYSNPLVHAEHFYVDNELITDLVIPVTVTEIKNYAFCCADFLTSVTIPNTVTSIGVDAFYNCYGLTGSLTIPYSVTSIGDHAFQCCYNLNAIYYTGDISQWCNIDFNGFYTNPLYDAHNLYIDNELVTDLVIPETVSEIKDYAFSGASCLTSLTIPNSVTSIGNRAFQRCYNMTALTIGNSVTSIGEYAFDYCTRLTGSLIIPNSVTSIGNVAFSTCRNITALTIGNSVTSIGSGAFNSCTNLETMSVFAATPPTLGNNTFNAFLNVNKSIPVYIPFGTTSAYQAALGWSEFTNFIEMDPPTNHYIPQGSAYSETMALYGVIQIDGVEQHSGMLEVGAFCGDECRGSAIASEFEITHRYLAILNIFGENGHQLTFKLYDHGTGEELELTSPAAITFDIDGYGNPIEPYVLNFTSTVAITATLDPEEAGTVTGAGDYAIGSTCTLTATANEGYQFKNWTLNGEVVSTEATYSFTVSGEAAYVAHFHYVHTQALASGWNWWSTYIEQQGIDGLEMLENSIGSAGVRIQGRDGTIDQFEYQGTNYWYGSLNAVANEQMYKIRTNADCNAVIVGDLASPSNHPITITNGWNWIGFPYRQSQSLDEVMSGFTPEANDVIKGRDGFSTYISYGSYNLWYGTLTVLEPGQGYMYKSNSDEAKTLTFQAERGNAVGNEAKEAKEDGFFSPNTADFSSNMLVTAVVEMGGQELRSEEYQLAAFVGNECRGNVRLMYVEPLDRYVAFLLVYGDAPDEVRFVLTDGNDMVCSDDCLTYAADGIEGSPTEPVTLHFGTLGLNESEQDVVNIFPNPSDGIFSIEGMDVRKIEVVDAYGQMILSKETNNDFERIDLSDKADGLYLLRVVTNKGITTKQLIKK